MKYTILILALLACTTLQLQQAQQGHGSSTRNYVIRLHPGQDLMTHFLKFAESNQLKAASIATCVGSVTKCGLRLADDGFLTEIQGDTTYEIVSLTGTVDSEGNPHVHISLSDKNGKTLGGHLPSLKERHMYKQDFSCPIYTTAELVITEHLDLTFTREIDPETTYDELIISERVEEKTEL